MSKEFVFRCLGRLLSQLQLPCKFTHRATQAQLDFQLLSPLCDYAEQTV